MMVIEYDPIEPISGSHLPKERHAKVPLNSVHGCHDLGLYPGHQRRLCA